MSNVGILSNLKIQNAQVFYDNFVTTDDDTENNSDNLYVFIGKTSPWPDDQNIPDVKNSLDEKIKAWRNISGIKKITNDDIAFGFRNIQWSSGRIFDEYDDSKDLSEKDFYAITDENKVYKCISYNNRSLSIIKPNHTTPDVSIEIDGYRWRYMFSIPESILYKFISYEYLPLVVDESIPNFSEAGVIVNNLEIQNPGSGYPKNLTISNNSEIPIFIQGDGDQNASAKAFISTSNGAVIDAKIKNEEGNGGSLYPYTPENEIPIAFRQVTDSDIIQSGYGIARTNDAGEIESVSVEKGGSGYVDGNVQLVQSSCRAYAETDSNGNVVNADLFTGYQGLNFTEAKAFLVIPEEEITNPAEIRPAISPVKGHASNFKEELFANYLLINLQLAGESSYIEKDDFRQVGVIHNPRKFGSNELFEDSIGDGRYRIVLKESNDNFIPGETLFGKTSGAKGKELSYFDDDTLRVIMDRSLASDIDFESEEEVIGMESNANGTIKSIEPPDIQNFSGDILYINNKQPIIRDNDLQLETVTLAIEY